MDILPVDDPVLGLGLEASFGKAVGTADALLTEDWLVSVPPLPPSSDSEESPEDKDVSDEGEPELEASPGGREDISGKEVLEAEESLD